MGKHRPSLGFADICPFLAFRNQKRDRAQHAAQLDCYLSALLQCCLQLQLWIAIGTCRFAYHSPPNKSRLSMKRARPPHVCGYCGDCIPYSTWGRRGASWQRHQDGACLVRQVQRSSQQGGGEMDCEESQCKPEEHPSPPPHTPSKRMEAASRPWALLA